MSQRLAFKVQSNGHFLSGACERWGGYTQSSAYVTDEFLKNLANNSWRDLDENGRIIRQSNPHKFVRDFCYDWPFDALFKNVEETNHYSDYADASVVVDIGKKTIHFDAFSHFTKNEAEECFGITDYSELEKVPSEISFDEWPDFSKKLEFTQFYVDDNNEFMTSVD